MYNIDWLNENANRSYPFKDGQSLLDETRRVALPNDFLVDARFTLSIDFQFDFYLSKLVYSPEILAVTVSMADQTEALSGVISNPDITLSNQALTLVGQERYLGSFGRIVIGSLDNLIEGEYNFLPINTTFEPCLIVKLNRGISSINGIKEGNVTLEEGANVVITTVGKKIRIDTFDGRCACAECPCIKTINGVGPNCNNNFDIEGVGCVVTTPSENGIQIGNECEEACCGCQEVNDMLDRIQTLENRLQALGG